MDYPIWEPFLSNSLLIAIVAILHVFVSHFAIGGGLYLVLAETIARRRNDADHLAYVERYSKFFVLVTLVFGAVTGVGIWVIIGLIQPEATGWLINNFVWGWATEWVFFLIEITAALIYYHTWKRLAPRTHLAIGWIYFIAAWLSLFIINGIVAFMLTPGKWLATGSFWDGFFNPAFWPSTFFRSFICLILAGLYATFTLAREKNKELKARLLRWNGVLVLGSLIAAVPFGWWYYRTLPEAVKAAILPGSIAMTALEVMLFCAALLFLLTLLGSVVFPRKAGYVSGLILMFLGLLSLGGFEWAREAARRPYIIHGFLYSNDLMASEAASLPTDRPLMTIYTTGDKGHDIYLAGCRSCHTISGYLSLSDRVAGLDSAWLTNIIPRLHYFRMPMPPFPGNNTDAAELAVYLMKTAKPDPLTAHPNMSESEKSKIVFDRRCGGCHTIDGYRPLGATFTGLDSTDANDAIMMLQEFTDQMPPYTGSDEEKALLIKYLTGAKP